MNKTENFRKSWSLINFCEFDKYASQSYCAIHGVDPNLNLGDITQINIEKLPTNIDLITHGSPCQSFSLSGKQHGGDKGSGTRSSLMWNSVGIIRHCKPKFVIWENVKNVLAPKHRHNFEQYIKELDDIGYVSHYKVMDASKYGVPQKRERIICVSIRKDIYTTFDFPKEIDLKYKLEDIIDFREKDDLTDNFISRYNEIFNTNISYENFTKYIEELPISAGIGCKKMGLYNFAEMDTITMPTGITGTLTCRNVQNYCKKFWYHNRLYKPSPKMVFRLMDFSDSDYEKANALMDDKHLYNQGGNSIVVNVMLLVFVELYKRYPKEFDDLKYLSLFSGIGSPEKALDRLYRAINLLEDKKREKQGEK